MHGEIYEREDPYTGLHYLEIGEEGFVDNGTAFVELNDESVSDITYFYIRANSFVPDSGKVLIGEGVCQQEQINDCSCLGPITDCDVPEWSPLFYVSGNTTVFLNSKPLVLTGGGGISTGIPPCPIGLNEPLIMQVVWRKVTDYFFSEELGDPLNDFLYPVSTTVGNNNFIDENEDTFIKHDSDIDIRIKVLWRGQNISDGTPVFTSIGDNKATSLFVASQNVYYTQTDNVVNYSYVDVKINARRPVSETTTEKAEIFITYDENQKTDRHVGEEFNLTLDKKEKKSDIPPPLPVVDPSAGIIVDPDPVDPYSDTVDRYNILTDVWNNVASMSEARGNGFSGVVGNYIYYMGGLQNNSLNVSNRNERYDISNDRWSDVTNMLSSRFGGMSFTIGNDIYLFGGISSNDLSGGELAVTTSVEVYHTDTDTWEILEPMPTVDEGGAFED